MHAHKETFKRHTQEYLEMSTGSFFWTKHVSLGFPKQPLRFFTPLFWILQWARFFLPQLQFWVAKVFLADLPRRSRKKPRKGESKHPLCGCWENSHQQREMPTKADLKSWNQVGHDYNFRNGECHENTKLWAIIYRPHPSIRYSSASVTMSGIRQIWEVLHKAINIVPVFYLTSQKNVNNCQL